MTTKRRLVMADVAKASAVSLQTVSRVLKGASYSWPRVIRGPGREPEVRKIRDFTIAPKLWWELLSEPLTDAAVGVFDANARELMS